MKILKILLSMKYALLFIGAALLTTSCSDNEYDIPGGTGDLLLMDGFYLFGEGSMWPALTSSGAFSERADGTYHLVTAFEEGATFNITSVIGGVFTKHGPGADLTTGIETNEDGDDIWVLESSLAVTDASFLIEKETTYRVIISPEELHIRVEELAAIPFDRWTVIGSAVGGWTDAAERTMSYNAETGLYSLTVDMTPGDFKFRAPEKDPSNAWAHNLGLVGDKRTVVEEANVALEAGGADINTPGGNYTITLDVENLRFTIVQNEAADLTDWDGVVLELVGAAISSENEGAQPDQAWSWGNVLLADNEGVPSHSEGKYTWTWEKVVIDADAGFKIRTLNGVAAPQNDINFDAGYDNLDAANSSSLVINDDGNLMVTETGEFTIVFMIDAVNANEMTITIQEYKEFPENVYMIGTDFGDWNWESDGIVEMLPFPGQEGEFWIIRHFNAANGFKWNTEKGWGGDFEQLGESVGFTTDAGNAFVPEDGLYMVRINYAEDRITNRTF